MKQSEIDYFLDGVVVKQQMIESIEGLIAELAKAMQPMFEPKLKEEHPWDKTDTEVDAIYSSTLNQYEKAVYLFLLHKRGPQTMQQIAQGCSISLGSVKRVIKSGQQIGYVMRAPFQPGYLLTQFA